MRLWGGSEPAQESASEAVERVEAEAVEGPKPTGAEAAMLGVLGKMPGVGEAIKGLFQMAQQFAVQQQDMAERLKRIEAMLQAEHLQQRGPVQVPLEGVVADGVRCAICGSTGACDCYGEQEPSLANEGSNNGEA